MSNPIARVGGTNDPFRGGAQQRRLLPPGVGGGGLGPANTNVGAPIQGVRVTEVASARQNSGSNVGLPYSRLVPLNRSSSKLKTVATVDDDNSQCVECVSETEHLRAHTIAFVYGTRAVAAAGPKRGAEVLIGQDMAYDARSVGAYALAAPMLTGPNKMSQVCSLEFLQAYFANVLSGKAMSINADLDAIVKSLPECECGTGSLHALLSARAAAEADGIAEGQPGNPGPLVGSTLLDMADFGRKLGLDGSEAERMPDNYQGIFARDFGPFLKGKGGPTRLVTCTNSNLPQAATPGGRVVRQPYSVSRNAGDDLAFDVLAALLAQNGLHNWTPDGIVLSVGADDPSDPMSDERIKGPAICTTWSEDRQMEVMPLDRVFVVLLADVWWSPETSVPALLESIENPLSTRATDYVRVVTKGVKTTADRALYREIRKAAVAAGLTLSTFQAKQLDAWKGKPETTVLTNFRVQQSTSSQMVNHGQFKVSNGVVGETMNKRQRVVQGRERMGLDLTDAFGAYVIGAWQVGAVLDSSASRGSMPQSNLGVRTVRPSAAHNINVAIGYFSPDRLARSFGNGDGFIAPRYTASRPDSEKTKINAQHESKAKFDGAAQ